MEIVLLVALLTAILLLVAAGIGGGLYLIVRPNRIVGNAHSPPWQPILVIGLRVAGAAMVTVALMVLYLSYWTVTGGPAD